MSTGVGSPTTIRAPLRVDVSGQRCPLTWVRTKIALERIESGAVLEVVLGPGEMLTNVPRNCADDGHQVLSVAPLGAERHLLTVRKAGRPDGAPAR